MAKQGELHSPWYHLYSGSIPHSMGADTPCPDNGGSTVAAYFFRSAESSGTTWAALHGSLHQPLPLLASDDRLLLPIIAVL